MNELTASQRAALENVLAAVIVDVGVDVFLTRPLVLPDETHFPDHFEASCWGVGGLLARLLRYAGLENAHVHVDDDALVQSESGPKDGGTVEVGFGMPVAFVGESEHMGELCLTFRVDLTAVADVDFLVGAAELKER